MVAVCVSLRNYVEVGRWMAQDRVYRCQEMLNLLVLLSRSLLSDVYI